MNKLEGVTVLEIRINEDKDRIKLILKDAPSLWISANGDCCSQSWFAHIEGFENLIGNKILKVIERQMPEPLKNDDFECLQFYGWTLQTEKGNCDIEMRNSSNGYYGGDVEVEEYPCNQYMRKQENMETEVLDKDF